jgi:hypothetical protein
LGGGPHPPAPMLKDVQAEYVKELSR